VQHFVYGIYSQIFVVIMYYSVVWSPAFMGIVRFWHTAIMVNKYSLFLYFLMNLASLLKYLQFYLSSQMAVDHLHYNTLIFSHSFEMNEWKCNDLKCVRKPTRSRLSLTYSFNFSFHAQDLSVWYPLNFILWLPTALISWSFQLFNVLFCWMVYFLVFVI